MTSFSTTKPLSTPLSTPLSPPSSSPPSSPSSSPPSSRPSYLTPCTPSTITALLLHLLPPKTTLHGRSSLSPSPKPTVTFSSLHTYQSSPSWYSAAAAYWESPENCTPDVSGVLGGFPSLSVPDVLGSSEFISRVLGRVEGNVGAVRCLDLGGGCDRACGPPW